MRGGDGDDKIYGGPGDDRLIGEVGADTLTGGAGRDTFIFDGLNVSSLSAPDVIVDFLQRTSSSLGDLISFDAIDANPGLTGNQDFLFADKGNFVNDGVARVRWYQSGTDTFVQADTGNGVADLHIKLTGTYTLTVNDFDL